MTLKKCNAILALLSVPAFLIHVGYNVFAYIAFFYMPALSILTAIPFTVLVCAHAICGMCTVFLMGDGTNPVLYPRQNAGTIIQRVSAALIFPLLIIHINSHSLLSTAVTGYRGLFFTVIVLQILFFAVTASHVAVSFSKAFVTLGILGDKHKKKIMDIITVIVCAVSFIIASICVVRGEIILFLSR